MLLKRLPCPNCGRENSEMWHTILGGNGWWVMCIRCGWAGRTKRTKTEAVRAWNNDELNIECEVTRWQPVPEAPREDEEDE